MKVQIRQRGPSSTKIKFAPGLPGFTPELQLNEATYTVESRYVGQGGAWTPIPGGDLDALFASYSGIVTGAADTATTKAGEAATSATNAANSATLAQGSADDAAASAAAAALFDPSSYYTKTTADSRYIRTDGLGTVTADVPFNAKKITGLGAATAGTDALNRDTADARFLMLSKGSAQTVADALTLSGAVTLGNVLNFVKGTDIASAATTDIGAATGNYVVLTGTATITSLGTAPAGTTRIVRFNGAMTLTFNSTSLFLPGVANITTAVGDIAVFVSDGSGNWRCTSYQRANGQAPNESKSLAANGYVKLASGLIIQWGIAFNASSDYNITFPIAFPTAAYSVVASPNANLVGTTLYAVAVDGIATTGAAFRCRKVTSGGTVAASSGEFNVAWVAIGV